MSSAYSTKSVYKAQNIFLSIDRRRLVLWAILFAAMVSFELFNFSTTQVALRDLLGDLSIMSVSWATILTFGFCGIDFGGIARFLIPEERATRSNETWYLFGAWLLAGTMNATLTWWGISLALVDRSLKSSAFINPNTLTEVVPVFLALMVWVPAYRWFRNRRTASAQ